MLLIYSSEAPEGLKPEDAVRVRNGHREVMEDAGRRGILHGAGPLASIQTATTVRLSGGDVVVTDGPFAETKEQLAGYYVLDCENLDEAIEWAARIPTSCAGGEGCIEIRPMRPFPEQSPI